MEELKKAAYILVLGLFVFNAIGMGCWLLAWKEWIAVGMEHCFFKPDSSDLVLFKTGRDQPAKREFSAKGQMYDVYRVERHGEEQWVYCYRDSWETDLIKTLQDNHAGPSSSGFNLKSLQFLQQLYTGTKAFAPEIPPAGKTRYFIIGYAGSGMVSSEVTDPPPWA